MRLFTAIELTDDVRNAIVATQRRVVSGGKAGGFLRLARPEHMHLTLVFIGELSEDRGAPILQAMSADLPLRPFRVAFGGLGAFPPRGAPRILYVDVLAGRDEMVVLHRVVAGRLAAAGVPPEPRPYHPHLTLGRWRESRPSDRPKGTGAVIAELGVEAVTLFQSRLSSSGPTYTRLAAAHLVCP